jgi:hypothetical protein
MAPRRNDPELRRQAVRMKRAGVHRVSIARMLGVCLTTVDWYVRHAEPEPPEQPYTLDAHGEKVSLPPAVTRYACPGCGMRADAPDGHPRCGVAA